MKKDDDLAKIFKNLQKNAKKSLKSSKNNKKSKENVLDKAFETAKKVDKNATKISNKASKSLPKEKRQKAKLAIKLVAYFVFLASLLISIPFSATLENKINHADYTFLTTIGDYSVHYIDVGQGDCTLIELPDNKIFMIDTGPAQSKNNLTKYLDGLHITTIDYLCFTHYDADHIGNGLMIFDKFEIKNVYIPKVYSAYEISNGLNTNANFRDISTNKTWNKLSEAIYNEGSTIFYNGNADENNIINVEAGYSITFWMPLGDYESSANNYSPFILMNLQNSKYMFTGDASSSKENQFLTQYSALVNSNAFDVDVLKLGHHGSKESSSVAFLNATKPEIAIVSCGKGNNYGHPNSETLDRLSAINCEVKRTDTLGSIVLTKNADSGKISSTTNFNHVSDFYLEWKYVLITGAVLLVVFALPFLKKKKM